MECLGHIDRIVPSPACILTKQHGIHSGKYPLKTHGNAISETNFQTIPRCLRPQELVPLVRVPKLPTIHYQPVT